MGRAEEDMKDGRKRRMEGKGGVGSLVRCSGKVGFFDLTGVLLWLPAW